ncbi:MAG: gliding motility-associated C-terminal domain-containing protein, partial [Cyanobacteria bacterium J06649_11]
SGNSNESNFAVENLSSGTYNLFVTDATGAEYIQENILLIAASSFPFEFKEITITNSSNGFHNGIIEVNLTGGIPPYSIRWSGASLGIVTELQDSTFAIDQLRQGEYEITASDNAGHQRKTSISLSHDNIPIPPCDRPLDIVILNDVSGSVTSLEYDDSKQYFLEFLQNINIGIGSEDNRAAIIEWSHTSEQSVQIPMTGDLSILQDYLNFDRVFNGANDVDDALLYGKNYLNDVARPGAERVIVFATDVTSSEITPSFAVLAGELKSAGYHLVTVVFDESYGNPYLRELFREVASDDLLAFSALSFSQLDQNLAEVLVSLYMCPISSGNLATSFFGRDGAINILSIEQRNPCIDSHYIQITIEIEAAQQLHIPIGTPITFYDSNPVTSEVAPVFVWELPCQIPAGVMEIFTVTLPVTETDDIFAVFNDDGIQSTPLVFPVTNTEEVKYSNNLASIIDYELPQPTVATEDVTLSVCQGETIVYNNMLLAAGDTQEFIFQSYSGCDSTVTVSVVEHPNNNEVLDLEVCPGEVVYFDGVELYIGEERTFVFTNTNGCDSTIIVKVLEKKGLDELISPNAFSPNGDGINDCFQPYIADNDLFYSYQLHIYDRWGELIFKTIDPNDCWDGSINDYAGSSGTYVWFVEITTEGCRNLIVSHGDVVLLR